MSSITLVAPRIKGFSGTASYVNNVLMGFKQNKIDFDIKYVKKREISLFGKPFFGILYQGVSAKFVHASTPIVHALAPEVVTSTTNIVTIHDIIPYTHPEIYMRSSYNRLAYKLAFGKALNVNHLLVSTNYGKEVMAKTLNISEDKLHVVYHSIDHEKFFYDPNSPYKSGRFNVVMLSDFNPRKRIDLVVRELLNDKEIDFYHIGPSQKWLNNYNKIISLTKNSNNIYFIGPQDINTVRRYISNADLFIYLSEEEGFGYPVLEAMACGTNVLVNSIPVFQELFQDHANFCTLENFSRNTIINAIKKGGNRERIIEFSKQFSVKNMAINIYNIYNEIM